MYPVISVVTALCGKSDRFDSVHQTRMSVQKAKCGTAGFGADCLVFIAVTITGISGASTIDSYTIPATVAGNGHEPVVVILFI